MEYKSILVFGPPGIGKGTQAKLLAKDEKYFHFSTGDMFRNMDKTNSIGKQVHDLISGGNFVPDELTIELFLKTLERYRQEGKLKEGKILILDGIPRTAKQVELLKGKIDVIKIIYFTSSSDEVLAERLQKRAVIEGRADDNLEVIKKRLEIYRRDTALVLEKYPKSIILEIDGMPSIEQVYKDMITKLVY